MSSVKTDDRGQKTQGPISEFALPVDALGVLCDAYANGYASHFLSRVW